MAVHARVHGIHRDRPAPASAAARAFEAFVAQKSFPCLGAKAALARKSLHLLCAHDIAGARDDRRIAAWLAETPPRCGNGSLFVSLAVLFPGSAPLTEVAFERALWRRLRAIHAIDRASHAWDASVSDDPASADFSMSVGGRAFYVVGMHPGASRPARRFRCPALVFNLHSQFEALRGDGRYEKLRRAIIGRDIAFAGSANPMLDVYGSSSEARQYSGRRVDAGWVWPFHTGGNPRR